MTIQSHDFSRPPSLHPETRTKLVQWLTRSNKQLAEVIAEYSLKVDVKLGDCVTAWPLNSLQEWSEKTVAFQVKLANVDAVSVIAVPNSLAQVLIGALMGEQPAEWPEERELSPGEASVGEFVVSRMIANLVDTWPGDKPASLQLVDAEPNLRRCKTFKPKDPIIVCRSTITTEIGSAEWCWLMPHEFLSELYGSVRTATTETPGSARQQLESLARDMTTQVTVRLGTVQLSPPQLAELRIGDLVVLNTKTTEPLRAFVSGKPRFLGWPGRVGTRQAFEITSEGNRRDRPAETAKEGGVTVTR